MAQMKKNSDTAVTQPMPASPLAVKRARGGFHFQRLPNGSVNISAKDIVSEHHTIAETTLTAAEWEAIITEMAVTGA